MSSELSIEEQLAQQRAILAREYTRWTISLLDGLKARLGHQVVTALDDMIAQDTLQEWEQKAAQEPGNTIEDLIRLLWEPLRAQGFEFTIERREDGVQMHCTRCPLADRAKAIGGAEWMVHLYCGTDPHMAAGFNPQMGFRRTKTLMEGHDCCDHFYFYKEQ